MNTIKKTRQGSRHRIDGQTGIRAELDGIKNIIHELQTALSLLDYEMRRDMDLLQRTVLGLEHRLRLDGKHEFYKAFQRKHYARDTPQHTISYKPYITQSCGCVVKQNKKSQTVVHACATHKTQYKGEQE
jgi:hypothetical protein